MDIVSLTPELAGDYLDFFDRTPHDDGTPEGRCYCVCWNTAGDAGCDFSTAENRRKAAEKLIREGNLNGYLSYESGKVIGWCAAGRKSEYLTCHSGRAYLAPLSRDDDASVRSILCFVVSPEYRRKGVATALCRKVCSDSDGYSFIEAYPIKEFMSEQYDFVGPFGMYEKLGFEITDDLGDRAVVRKKL